MISFWLVQIFYFILICFLRPYDTFKENLIELINEGVFTVLSGFLLYLNEEDRWSEALEKTFTYLIVANTVAISLVL